MHYNVYDVYYSQFSHQNMLLRKATGSKTLRNKRFISSDKKKQVTRLFLGGGRETAE